VNRHPFINLLNLDWQQAAAEKQMSIQGHYDTLMASSEGQHSTQTYNLFTLNTTLERLKGFIHLAMQNDAGADPEPSSSTKPETSVPEEGQETEGETKLRNVDELPDEAGEANEEGPLDWSVEREIEITRLEKENEELRRQLGILDDPEGEELEPSPSPAYAHRHTRTSSAPFGAGFTTSSALPSPQPPNMMANPFAPPFPGAQGYNPPSAFTQPDRKFPPQSRPLGPAPPQITPRTSFVEGNMGARQPPPSFPNFFRGPPPRDRVDLAGGQPPLL
jgi:hypothetical protein